MADESNKEDPATETKESGTTVKKQQRGLISRIWHGLFRLHGDDFEKRLQHISKEEASVLARMKRRSQSWRMMIRNLIIFSVIFEAIAVGYAIMTTRSLELNWKMRAFRVLPMFLLPGLSSITYSALVRFTRMCDRKDQKTLERLLAERQSKINELKEKTNYYITQQLIQRYDPDPAAKAAAATVLASKLGADSGLKVYVGDESTKLNAPSTGKSNDVELVQSSGLRNRKQLHPRSSSPTESTKLLQHSAEEEALHNTSPVNDGSETSSMHNQLVVDHYNPGSAAQDGGWIARIAALLVGEDPTQSYALICGNCHMHNGLARKEDFPYITYYCPHCNALNRSNHAKGGVSDSSNYPNVTSPVTTAGDINPINNADSVTMTDRISASSSSPVAAAASETMEATERVVASADLSPVS
ncbi:protein of unknown function DUF2296 protein [Actinidia chinensis var. chinensis]|uniref:Lunapark zinc ribbon domain-containing protein n=1 Tax=Actinidia chinensis var. chinensis TaxID=1590841 RepID=A0A2R6RAN1_ACTCC|nr:protein of unknown function DUF2296 protein [Actinidia chinensis var. chinensis]